MNINELITETRFILPFKTIYQIKPMENSPQCMIYIPWKTESMNEDTILFGDDQGRFYIGKI